MDLAYSLELLRLQTQTGERLRKEDELKAWVSLHQWVSRKADKHYKSRQDKGLEYKLGGCVRYIERGSEIRDYEKFRQAQVRVLLAYEFILDNPDKSVAYCLSSLSKRWAWFEVVVFCAAKNLSFYAPEQTITKRINCIKTRNVAKVQKLLREKQVKYSDYQVIKELEGVSKTMLRDWLNFNFLLNPKDLQIRETRCTKVFTQTI